MYGIGPKIPLARDGRSGYKLVESYREEVKQNLKNLILTAPGERVMLPDFGVGVRQLLFEQDPVVFQVKLETRVTDQVRRYLPVVRVNEVSVVDQNGLSASETQFDLSDQTLYVWLNYSIGGSRVSELLTVEIN